jgi:hypothetical protein
MVILSKARRMQSQLRLLRHERGLILDDAPVLPLLDPCQTPMIMSGVASRAMTLDYDRIRTVPRAFGPLPDPAAVPLRLDHTDTVVGSIEELAYDADGSLLIVSARVTDQRAVRMPAFSIAAAVDEYDIDERDISATITRCRLMEISLVACPCDSNAIVLSREPPLPAAEFFVLMQQRVRLCMKMVDLIASTAQRSDHAHA